MTKDEALRLALEALKSKDGWGSSVRDAKEKAIAACEAALEAKDEPVACCNGYYKQGYEAGFAGQQHYIHALQEALAKQEQGEPVAWYRDEDGIRIYYESKVWDDATPLYTTPPQRTWVGLTDDEIAEVEDEYIVDYRIPAGSAWNFAKDIEAKLKEKNT